MIFQDEVSVETLLQGYIKYHPFQFYQNHDKSDKQGHEDNLV